MNYKRGFSLVEVVVAIAILVTISVLTFGIVGNSRNILFQSEAKMKAANEAENIIKIYNIGNNIGNNIGKLDEYYKQRVGTIVFNDNICHYYLNGKFEYVNENNKYYDVTIKKNNNNIIENITFKHNNEIVYEYSIEKIYEVAS